MKFVLASKNPNKLVEMQQILGEMGVEVVLESDVGVDIEVEETGETFEENAALKAVAVMRATGLPTIADDSGLCVEALGGAPGVYSARYGGEGANGMLLVLENLRGQINRRAKFVSCVCCVFPDGHQVTARGECQGNIAFAPIGTSGFGYDPIFLVPSMRKTYAQMTAEEKNSISHRRMALEQFKTRLEADLNGTDQ